MTPSRTTASGLSAIPDYRRLFAAQVTSLLGSGITSVALAAFAYQLVGGNATVVVGTALMLRILAFVLVSPVAGVLADRVDRKRMLITADLVRFGLLALFPFISHVWQIYGLIFAINAVTAFFTPTYEAALPQVVGPRLYTRALSASRVALDFEAALGPLIGGALIAAVGARLTFWFDAASYLISALLVLGARVPRAVRPTAPFPWRSVGPELAFGSRILLREPALRRALVIHVAEAAAGAAVIVTTVVYIHDVLGRSTGSFALAMGAFGAGSTVAALLLARGAAREVFDSPQRQHLAYHRTAERTLLAGGALSALALLPGALEPGFGWLLLLWALVGAGGALIAISSVGLLAAHTAPDERGRAYAAHFGLTHLVWLATYPAAGYLARAAGTPWTFTAAGIVCGLATLVAAGMRSAHREHSLS